MPNIIGRQAEAFADAVMAEHYEAMQVADIIDVMRVSILLAAVVNEHVIELSSGRRPSGDDDDFTAQFAKMASSMPKVAMWAKLRAGEGHSIDGAMIVAYEHAAEDLQACLNRLEAVRDLSDGDGGDDLPSMEELERRLATFAATESASAQANGIRLIGRPQL